PRGRGGPPGRGACDPGRRNRGSAHRGLAAVILRRAGGCSGRGGSGDARPPRFPGDAGRVVAVRGRRRLDPPGPRDRDPLVAGRARMVRSLAPRAARRLIDRATATGAVTMGAMKPLWSALALALSARAAEHSRLPTVDGVPRP